MALFELIRILQYMISRSEEKTKNKQMFTSKYINRVNKKMKWEIHRVRVIAILRTRGFFL